MALTTLVTQQAAAAAAQQQADAACRLEDILLQQTAAREAQVPTPPTPVEVVAPWGSSPALDTSRTASAVAPREEVFAAPPAQVPVAAAVFPVIVEESELDRLMDRLSEFFTIRCSAPKK